MNHNAKPWTEIEDSFLRTGREGCMSIEAMARVLGRTHDSVARRVRTLKLPPQDMNQARRDRLLAIAQERSEEPRPKLDRDDEHWRACLAAGGFPASVRHNGATIHLYPEAEAA